jgi:integrase/recombinase XerD
MAIAARSVSKSPFSEATMTLYLDHLQAGARAKSTTDNYRYVITKFLTLLRGRPVGVPTIQEFIGAYRSSNARSFALVVLRQWFQFLIQRGLIAGDPSKGIPYAKVHRRDYPPVSEDDFQQLLAALTKWPEMQVLGVILFRVGTRISETLAIQAQDVTFEDSGFGTIGFPRRKGGGSGFAAFGPEVTAVLRPFIEGKTGPIFSRTAAADQGRGKMQSRLIQAGERAGIHGRMTAHRLRHAFITRAVDAGWNQLALQQQVGHNDPTSTAWYFRPTRAGLIQNVRRTTSPEATTPAAVVENVTHAPGPQDPPTAATPEQEAETAQLRAAWQFVNTVADPAARRNGNGAAAGKRQVTVILPVDGSVRASHARALMHLLEQVALQLEGGEAR